ncbi:MAG: PAS domain-containing sensor histidine kinase [Polyangiaceae bacterium]
MHEDRDAKACTDVLLGDEEPLRAVFMAMAEGVVLQAPSGEITSCNPAAERILGLSADQMRGRTSMDPRWRAIRKDGSPFAGEDHPGMVTLRTGEPVVGVIMGVHRPDGTLTWISITSAPLRHSPTEPPYAVVATFTDVTALEESRREVERVLEQVRDDEARFRRTFEQHAAIMLVLDPETAGIIEVNPAAARYYGYDRDAFCKMSVMDLNPVPRERIFAQMSRVMRGEISSFEVSHRLSSGVLRRTEVRASPIELRGRTLLFAIMQDIEDREAAREALARERTRRRLEEQLEELNATLERRIEESVRELRRKDQMLITQGRLAAMGEMLGHIAHQWRQPLNAISLVFANLEDAAESGPVDAATVADAVVTGSRLVRKMSSTIDDFRRFFRVDKERHPFDVRALVRETVALVDATYRSARVVIREETMDAVTVEGTANEYSQVVLNILGNAKEAIESAGRGGGQITLSLIERDGQACLTVRDDGGGISEEVADRIFEPYFSTKPNGTGIGLHMSRQIIENSFGGRIRARNIPGGAELTVEVPLRPPEGPSRT